MTDKSEETKAEETKAEEKKTEAPKKTSTRKKSSPAKAAKDTVDKAAKSTKDTVDKAVEDAKKAAKKAVAAETDEATGEKAPFDLFVEHQRKAFSEATKALEGLVPSDFKDHTSKGFKEMIEGYRSIFNAAIDEIIETVEKAKLLDEDEKAKQKKD